MDFSAAPPTSSNTWTANAEVAKNAGSTWPNLSYTTHAHAHEILLHIWQHHTSALKVFNGREAGRTIWAGGMLSRGGGVCKAE